MKVTVTARDIKTGEACAGSSCPVARALNRAIGTRSVCVGCSSYYCFRDAVERTLPTKVIRFVRDFDTGMPVEPFSFVIKRPKKKGSAT